MKTKIANKKIVCLGGGIGTVNLIKGLSDYTNNISVITSTADSGGSSGRLRRLYKILPMGDLISCMSTLCSKKNSLIAKLLTYRFPGDRYGRDDSLGGQKLGNLIMVALRDLTGSFENGLKEFQKVYSIEGTFLPATSEEVNISAVTHEGKEIFGEENIDLGKYNGQRVLKKVILHPKNPSVSQAVIKTISSANVIIAGPGDLYTTVLPVMIIPKIKDLLIKSSALKIFVVNVANKPFETKGYKIKDYIVAIKKHLGCFPFDKIFINNNFSVKIPKKYKYSYVEINKTPSFKSAKLVKGDFVDEDFPLYHCPAKLAKAILENI